MVCKLRFASLEVLLPLLKLLQACGLFLLECPQAVLRLATMLGGCLRLNERVITGHPSLSGFPLALGDGGLGLSPGLFGLCIDLEPR